MSTVKSKKTVATATNGLDAFDNFAVASAQTKTNDKKTFKITDPEVIEQMKVYLAAKAKKAEIDKVLEESGSIIKKHAMETFYIPELKNVKEPDSSFIITAKDDVLLYGVNDAYKKIDEDRVNYLNKTYGDGILAEKVVTISLSQEMAEKHGASIVKAIKESKDIPDNDKAKIFTRKTEFRIKKGTIKNIVDLSKKVKKSVNLLIEEIIPTQFLKLRGEK